MLAPVAEFAEVLRQNGLRISPAEVADALLAASAVGVAEKESFRAALKSTLVKRERDGEAFDNAFHLFFSGAASLYAGLDETLARQLEEQGILEGDELAHLLAWLSRLSKSLSPLAQAALSGNRAELGRLFRGASVQLDFSRLENSLQAGFYARRLLAGAGMDKARAELSGLSQQLAAAGHPPSAVEFVSQKLNDTLRRLEEAARSEVARQAQARLGKEGLTWRPLSSLSPGEWELAQSAVRRLAEKLKARKVKRRAIARGDLWVRRTLRQNAGLGGVPMKPAFRRKRPHKPEVVVLCDVSDSVRNSSRLMLLFMQALSAHFSRVRAFVFVSELGEVTEALKRLGASRALDLSDLSQTISLSSNSNYGRALSTFAREHLSSVNRRTSVLILGDGRNNYFPNEAWALRDIQRKAKRVLWICPEDPSSWSLGDSEMATYSRYCKKVAALKSLEDFPEVAEMLTAD